MKNTLVRILLSTATALALSFSSANAELLSFQTSGTLSALNTLNGTALGVDTAFSYTLNFDRVTDYIISQEGGAFYSIHDLRFTLGGTTYGTSSDSLIFFAWKMPVTDRKYNVGLYDTTPAADGATLSGGFSGATPDFDVNIITPSVLSGPYEHEFSADGNALTISLTGLGDLVIDSGLTQINSASIDAVPEPSFWAMLGLGFPVLCGALRRYGRRA